MEGNQMNIRQYAVRLRHDNGTVTLETAATDAAAAVRVVLVAEGASARSVVWVAEQPVCDYCDQPATRRVRESGESVCAACARSQTDGPVREYVTPLAATQWPRVSATWQAGGGLNHQFRPLPAPADHHCATCGGTKAGVQHIAE